VILPPKVVWVKTENTITEADILAVVKREIYQLPYQKLVIWCGTVDDCIRIKEAWDNEFPDFIKAVDYNNCNDDTFDKFYRAEKKALLFCAVKHREGSDIPNLDGCVFMDKVERRSERVFIQSMGRVLRLDKAGKKKYGLVVDVRAKSSIEVCNRVQYYLKLKDVFPWHYSLEVMRQGAKTYYINSLTMKEGSLIESRTCDMERYEKSDIVKQFIREMPKGEEYAARLDKEITLMIEKNLFGNVMRAMEILALTKDIPHVTRGSCGSSLVCYLLGISHVDPVKHNISFARFINQYRTTLPDIDFDFPHYLRDEVFLKLFQKWGSKVARISNHNYYHEKSALRESLRRNGVNEFISKYELQKKIDSYDKEFQEQIYDTQKELDGTFRGYSLHCGGIIYFPDGVPEEYILDESERKIIPQVHLNKYDVSEQKTFKIDILSSRALSQLYYCRHFKDIDFNSHLGDEATIALLCSGNNVGITLAETPLMKKALILVQPKTIMDLAICLAIIRPAAKDAKKEFEMGKVKKHTMIFDDDIIQLLAKLFKCDEELADKFRRGYCKDDKETHRLIDKKLSVRPKSTQTRIKNILSNLRKYGFCKSHALSYAQLVWQLAYEKAHHSEIFWKSTLKNTKTCYRKWVHIYEARCSSVDHSVKDNEGSLYAKQRQRDYSAAKPLEQLRNAGYWYGSAFYPGCYYTKRDDLYLFHGVVASSRLVKRGKRSLLILCVGISEKKFIGVLVNGRTNYNTKKVLVQGRGALKRECEHFPAIECKAKEMMFI
jgi:DNA polymerase III alpha subunit